MVILVTGGESILGSGGDQRRNYAALVDWRAAWRRPSCGGCVWTAGEGLEDGAGVQYVLRDVAGVWTGLLLERRTINRISNTVG